MYCIYRITNNLNGKTYIGQHEYTDESNPMGKYKGSGILLHKAYKKYGIENFAIEILYQRIRDKSTIDSMEIWAISKYKPEYNIAKGGTGGKLCETYTPWNKGKKMPANWNVGRKFKHSDHWKEAVHNSKLGHKVDAECRNKIRETLKLANRHWYTNGQTNKLTDKCPEGFRLGRTL